MAKKKAAATNGATNGAKKKPGRQPGAKLSPWRDRATKAIAGATRFLVALTKDEEISAECAATLKSLEPINKFLAECHDNYTQVVSRGLANFTTGQLVTLRPERAEKYPFVDDASAEFEISKVAGSFAWLMSDDGKFAAHVKHIQAVA